MNNEEDDDDKDDSLIAKIITIVLIFVIFILLGCVIGSYANRSRTDLCRITEVTEYRDDNGVIRKRTVIYFVPQDDRPFTL